MFLNIWIWELGLKRNEVIWDGLWTKEDLISLKQLWEDLGPQGKEVTWVGPWNEEGRCAKRS